MPEPQFEETIERVYIRYTFDIPVLNDPSNRADHENTIYFLAEERGISQIHTEEIVKVFKLVEETKCC